MDLKKEFSTKIVTEFSQQALADILLLEQACYPLAMQYEASVAENYYTDALRSRQNINIFLLDGEQVVGYILAVPHNAGFDEIIELDLEYIEQDDVLYVETIQVSPQCQGRGGAKKLLATLCEEAGKMGLHKFSIHAIRSNGLSGLVKKLFAGKIGVVREIAKWAPGNGEPYEYIEWDIGKQEI